MISVEEILATLSSISALIFSLSISFSLSHYFLTNEGACSPFSWFIPVLMKNIHQVVSKNRSIRNIFLKLFLNRK